MEDITDKELSEMIADLSMTDNWPDRARLCHALIELRYLRTHPVVIRELPWWQRVMSRLGPSR